MRIVCILAALAAAAYSFTVGTIPYPVLMAAALFVLAGVIRKDRDDTRILVLATGELLVIAVAAVSFPAGVVVQGAVIGAVLFDMTGLPDKRDATLFALWCMVALAGAVVLYLANQVLIPFLVLTAGVAGLTALLVGIQEMRERRMFAGGD